MPQGLIPDKQAETPIVCLHTVPTLLAQFQALPAPALHLVDEVLLHSIANSLAPPETHLARIENHRASAVAVGARVFFVTCSTLSPLLGKLPECSSLYTLAIDEAMIEAAAQSSGALAVVATNPAALRPCCELLAAAGRTISGPTLELPEAFAAFRTGDFARHDRLLLDALGKIDADAIVLAQASMARILPMVSPEMRARLLTSSQLAIAKLERLLAL